MSPVRFYRLALLGPIVLPLALFPVARVSVIETALLFSLVFGGPQYVIFAAVLYYVVGRLGDAERIERLAYYAPLLFLPVQFAGLAIETAVAGGNFREAVESFLLFAIYAVVIGYAYVVATDLVYRFANSRGYIQSSAR